MRFLKVLGILLIVAAACRLVLFLLTGHGSLATGGRYAGELVGGVLFIFAVAAIAAGIAALISRGRGYDFPGLQTGFVAALAITAMAYAGGG
jgi:cytochrome b561